MLINDFQKITLTGKTIKSPARGKRLCFGFGFNCFDLHRAHSNLWCRLLMSWNFSKVNRF